MRAEDIFYPDYNVEVERALDVFYGKHENSDSDFVDSCQLLIDSGVWLTDKNIGETCLFLLENGYLLLPEHDQIFPGGGFMILGTSRKNVFN